MTAKQSGDATVTQGVVLCIIGLAVMGFAYFAFETGVDSPLGSVSNLDLLQRQMMIFHAGAAFLLLGGAFVAAGFIIRAIAGGEE